VKYFEMAFHYKNQADKERIVGLLRKAGEITE